MVNKPTTHQASVYNKISTDPFSSKSQTDITQNMESAQESLIHMYNQIMEELTICIIKNEFVIFMCYCLLTNQRCVTVS
jgi:beta-mannanase